MTLLHASCVSFLGQGILLTGASGSGKSQLALRLIDHGAWLVSDDQTALTHERDGIVARPPQTLTGLLEIRGIGIVRAPHQASTVLHLVLDLDPADRPSLAEIRMPPISLWRPPYGVAKSECGTVSIPCCPFDAFRPDAPLAALSALAQLPDWREPPAR